MANRIGPALSRRLLKTQTIGVAGTTSLRRLWMHAIATAIAAQELATQTGLMDPEEAYLLGLLHDLPMWLVLVTEQNPQASRTISPEQWIAHWQLPAKLVALFEARRAPAGHPLVEQPTDATALVFAAELLAELAAVDTPDADFGSILRRICRRLLAHGVLMAFALVAIGDADWRLPLRRDAPPVRATPSAAP